LLLIGSASYRLTPRAPKNQNAEVSHDTKRMANSATPAMGNAPTGIAACGYYEKFGEKDAVKRRTQR
jgi:hypothetical protein